MKKRGFTLAEVLITLGIVGVVAALTAPTLVTKAGSAQIGPKLAKAVNTFEVANENMLNDAGAATLRAAGALDAETEKSPTYSYIGKLSNYMKISAFMDNSESNDTDYSSAIRDYNGNAVSDTKMVKKPNGKFTLVIKEDLTVHVKSAAQNLAYMKDGTAYGIAIHDVTGADNNAAPHKRAVGTVIVDINGDASPNRLGKDVFVFSLMADGSLSPFGSNQQWDNGDSLCNESTVTDGYTCAGSIFENNLKVIYQ